MDTGTQRRWGVSTDTPVPRVEFTIAARTVFKITAVAGLTLLAWSLLADIGPIILSVVIALFLAVAADPLVRMLERRGLGRGISVATIAVGGLLVLAAFAALFVPPLIDQADRLVDDAPSYVQEIRDNDTFRKIDERFDVLDRLTSEAERLPGKVSREVASVAAAVATSLFAAFTVIFLTILLLLNGGKLVNNLATVFPQLTERRWWGIVQDSYRSVGGYVSGVSVIAVIAGTAVLIMELILGLPSPLPLALWMMVFVPVPLIGSTIGAIPVVVVAFAAGGLWKGLAMIAFVFVYQQFENAVLQPAILGRFVQLSPIIVFVSVLIGAQLLGILGALLAIPTAGILQILLREWLDWKGIGDNDAELPPIAPDDAPDPPDPEQGAATA